MDVADNRERRLELEERRLLAHDRGRLLNQEGDLIGRQRHGRAWLLCEVCAEQREAHLSESRTTALQWQHVGSAFGCGRALSMAARSFSMIASIFSVMDAASSLRSSAPGANLHVHEIHVHEINTHQVIAATDLPTLEHLLSLTPYRRERLY